MSYTSIVVLISIAITFGLRALPFIAFRNRSMPEWLNYLGKVLPPTIMAVLVVYCLKEVPYDWSYTGVAGIAGVLVTIVSYKKTHNTFLGILLGTVTNMLLLHLL